MTKQHVLSVINPGIDAQYQDAGRFGTRHIGLSQGGAIDSDAYYWANTLVGNSDKACVIEVTIGGLTLYANEHCRIAITGAKTDITINGKLVPMWQTLSLSEGDTLAIGYCKTGCRLYLAVAGGFTSEALFDSQSTVRRESLGGIEPKTGRSLRANDRLSRIIPVEDKEHYELTLRLSNIDIPTYPSHASIRVVVGYQSAWFSRYQTQRFFHHDYTVTSECNRMGYRLDGTKIEVEQRPMLSEGITLGAIQIPPNGQPIVMLNDHQTIGGYPKIGAVLSIDLAKLGQCQQGNTIRFEPINEHDAHQALLLHRFKREQITPEVL